MPRSERLLNLLQLLRQYRRPVSGAKLAAGTGVSLRTLYRDIATLQALGISVEGEAGVGYVLAPGSLLPPLMFPREEIEALLLAAQWVDNCGDDRLRSAIGSAMARIGAVLPADHDEMLASPFMLVAPRRDPATRDVDLTGLREAIRRQRKVRLDYRDDHDRETGRIVWPFALAYFQHAALLMAWCELRDGFRHFRVDRIIEMHALEQRYPRRRQELVDAWQRHDEETRSRKPADRN